MRTRFGTLLGVVLGAMAIYAGYWFYAIDQAEHAFYAFVKAEQARGNSFEYGSVSFGGFPIRLGATVTGVKYSAGGLELEAGQVLIETLPWNLTNALVRAEGNVRLAYLEPDRPERIEMKPSLIFARVQATWQGVVQQAAIEIRDPDAKGAGGNGRPFAFKAQRLQADARMADVTTDTLDSYDLAFSADRVDLAEGFPTLLGPRLSNLRFVARFTKLPPFSTGYRPADRRDLVRTLQANGVEAEIARFDFDWGNVVTRGIGRLALDGQRRLAGQLDFKVQGLARLIDLLFALGILQGQAQILKDLPTTPEGELISLTLKDGLIAFGPYAVGALKPLD
ncbi:MAG: DUF2125 domain-containing protein [Alphaproteobacteria bacterium]|nr:DUF2125 domain-containing protein [Alphaproteobacteria bacterium]